MFVRLYKFVVECWGCSSHQNGEDYPLIPDEPVNNISKQKEQQKVIKTLLKNNGWG
jgi:hypothetical protein